MQPRMKPKGWIELTQPDGVLCYHKAESIDRVGPNPDIDARGTQSQRAQTELRVSGQLFRVLEPVSLVLDLIREA